jgi:hypothetical protein
VLTVTFLIKPKPQPSLFIVLTRSTRIPFPPTDLTRSNESWSATPLRGVKPTRLGT